MAIEIGLQQAQIVHRRHHHGLRDAFARGDLEIFRSLDNPFRSIT